MRVFQKMHGHVMGSYPCFDDVKEAVEYLQQAGHDKQELFLPYPDKGELKQPFKHWYWAKKGDEGKYFMSDDGWIAPVLKIYEMKRGKYEFFTNGNPAGAVALKMPFGTYVYSRLKSGDKSGVKMLVSKIPADTVSFVTKSRIAGKFLTKKKMMFAYLMYATGDPVFAYKRGVLKGVHISQIVMTEKLLQKAFDLLKDEYVINEIKSYMPTEKDENEFKERMKQCFIDNGVDGYVVGMSIIAGLRANETNKLKTGGMGHAKFIELMSSAIEYANGNKPSLIGNKEKIEALDPTKAVQALPGKEPPKYAPPRPEIMDKVNEILPQDKEKGSD